MKIIDHHFVIAAVSASATLTFAANANAATQPFDVNSGTGITTSNAHNEIVCLSDYELHEMFDGITTIRSARREEAAHRRLLPGRRRAQGRRAACSRRATGNVLTLALLETDRLACSNRPGCKVRSCHLIPEAVLLE